MRVRKIHVLLKIFCNSVLGNCISQSSNRKIYSEKPKEKNPNHFSILCRHSSLNPRVTGRASLRSPFSPRTTEERIDPPWRVPPHIYIYPHTTTYDHERSSWIPKKTRWKFFLGPLPVFFSPCQLLSLHFFRTRENVSSHSVFSQFEALTRHTRKKLTLRDFLVLFF